MKKTLLLAAIVATLSTSGQAATLAINDAVSTANQTGNGPHSNEGAIVKLFTTEASAANQVAMPNGNRFRIGFFLNLSDPASLVGKSMSQLTQGDNRFIPLGEGSSGDGRMGGNTANLVTSSFSQIAGRINKSFTGLTYLGDGSTANTDAAGGVARSTRLYLMIFDSASIAGDTAWGLYSADTWVIPSDIGTNTTFTVRLEDIDTPAEVMRGSLGSLHLAGVPEPGSASLGLLAVGASLARRRRR